MKLVLTFADIPSPRFSGERKGPIAKQWEGEGPAGNWTQVFNQEGNAALRRPLPLTLPTASRRAPTLSPLRFACGARVKGSPAAFAGMTEGGER
jgi:hypothetical protein